MGLAPGLAPLRLQTGEAFEVFQDRLDIAWGQAWQQRIDESLDAVTFLIPVITPASSRASPVGMSCGIFQTSVARRLAEMALHIVNALDRAAAHAPTARPAAAPASASAQSCSPSAQMRPVAREDRGRAEGKAFGQS